MKLVLQSRILCIILIALLIAPPGIAQAPVEGAGDASRSDARVEGEAEPADDEDADADEEDEAEEEARDAADDAVRDFEPDLDIEDITVTGTETEGLKSVPIAVTQFGAADIQNLRIQDIADLSSYTPNLEINTAFAASNPTLFIRGIGLKDYNSNSAGAVAIIQDGVMMNSPVAQLFSIFDIQSIEVLRGPQGSGSDGRNATAGAIKLHAYKPDGEYSSSGSFTYGNYRAYESEGAIGFPIFPEALNETLSARFAFTANFRDGYVTNECADWDPEKNGFLESSQEFMQQSYQELLPSNEPIPVIDRITIINGPILADRYVFENVELFETLSASEQFSGDKRELPVMENGQPKVGPDGKYIPSGVFVGIQPDKHIIGADEVCLIAIPGRVLTAKGKAEDEAMDPEDQQFADKEIGDFLVSKNALTLEDFQGLKHKQNNVKNWATRGMLRWQPTDDIDFLVNGHWGRNRGDSFHLQTVGIRPVNPPKPDDPNEIEITSEPLSYWQADTGIGWDERNTGFEPTEIRPGIFGPRAEDIPQGTTKGIAGANPYHGFYNRDGREVLDLWGISLTQSKEFDGGRIASITGFEKNERYIEDEGDAIPAIFLEADYHDRTWQATQELKVEAIGDNYNLSFGGFYIHEELVSRNVFFATLSFLFDQNFEQTLDAFNVGMQGRYDFLEDGAWTGLYQISLDAGIRYNWERKVFALSAETFALGSTAGFSLPLQVEEGIWTEPTGDVTLSYKPVENATLYTKFTHGMKAGHFNAGLTVQPFPGPGGVIEDRPAQSIAPVEPEIIDAFEVGLKANLFDDRFQLSAAFFRYWYSDLQVFDIVNEQGALPTQQLLNSDADVLGAEVEIQVVPFEGFLIQAGFGWLDTEYVDFIVSKQVEPGEKRGGAARTIYFDYSGNQLLASPEFSVSAQVEWEIMLSRWGSIIPSYDFSWKSRTYLDPGASELISQEGYWRHNARLAYRTPGGNIEVAGWVQNFLDETYVVDKFDLSNESDLVSEIYGMPRTYGFTVSYMW